MPYQNVVGTYIEWEALGIDPAVIAENSARVKGRVIPATELSDEPVALVAFGTSLQDTWEQIKDFKVIYTCSGSHAFLLDKGIVPTYHVDSDPRAYKATILGEPHSEVTYLIASVCHPTYFDKLEVYGAHTKIWHIFFPPPQKAILHVPVGDWIFTGGHTVGPRLVKMARVMGYKNLHIFGIDGSLGKRGQTHASEHPNPPKDLFLHHFRGKDYLTFPNWLDHVENLLVDLDRMPEVTYKFYGEGLMQAKAADHVRSPREWQPLAFILDGIEGRDR